MVTGNVKKIFSAILVLRYVEQTQRLQVDSIRQVKLISVIKICSSRKKGAAWNLQLRMKVQP